MTINEAIPKYLEYVKLYNKKDTLKYYKQYLRFIAHYIGDINIHQLTRDDVLHMLERKKLENPQISNSSLNKYIGTVKSLYKFTTGKTLNVVKLKHHQKLMVVVNEDIIKRIFAYYEKRKFDPTDYRNYMYFRLALDTGLRLNELINVKIKNIDLESNTIDVTVTKTDKDRTVVFSPKTKVLLTTFILAYAKDYEYLFTNFKNGKQLSKSSIHSMTLALKQKLGIKENFNPHSWRHTFATSFIRKNGNIAVLKELLGHSTVRTTQKYLHFNKQDLLKGYVTVFDD